MICEADIKMSWRARPRGFVALMGLYESNYLRFLQLAGDPTRLAGTLISRVSGDCELHLAVLEHMPYTSTLTLTYVLSGNDGPATQRLPDLRLRAYHDARLLEAERFQAQQQAHPRAPHKPRGQDTAPRERELHQRWMRNMMLNKWLEYCAERGHRFAVP
ncbi:MAG TPA: DUF1249 domain-containing protein [Steroidobacteraceae bacterium]